MHRTLLSSVALLLGARYQHVAAASNVFSVTALQLLLLPVFFA